ncbi:TSC22 domain family protein 1 isoform X1 [Pristis pectinata]|uniref:TSC22 domain family protein 1 isoform X1 n=1 Tax=Pristis pectinata TaxID=685728 RepID=UPI00223E85AD|nr:TSC22 domain family protein 1 isoform X1 [Pristis pectinata]
MMQQSESAADRKMAQPLYPRRSSSAASAAASSATLGGLMGAAAGRPHPDEIPPGSMRSAAVVPGPSPSGGPIPPNPGSVPPPAAPHPPQSLSLHPSATPPGPVSVAGAQIKKKSGFQITSVTPAQNNAGSNNSIAEDTESYDDMDESHTEDLSSSEILDISRATDYEPERSSSEETLNNVGDAETPSALSPNQPRLPQHQTTLFNGSIHGLHPHHLHHPHPLHHHHHHHHLHPAMVPGSGMVGAAAATPPTAGGITPFANVASSTEKNSISAPMPGLVSSSVGPSAPLTSNITPANGNARSVSGVSNVSSNVSINVGGTSGGVNANSVGGTTSVIGASSTAASTSAAGGQMPAGSQQPAIGSSRFRVVKLDSSTEPFKKGRWVCTEFYDKDNATVLVESMSMNRTVESVKQAAADANLERESTSGGSSVSSTLSAVGYYVDNAGNGEPGLASGPQQQAFQALCNQQLDLSSSGPLPQSVSQPQLTQIQLHSQDVMHSQQKPSAPLSGRTNVSNVTGVQQAPIPQQLPYPQQQPSQTLSAVGQPQQLSYPQQQPASQITTQHVMSSNASAVITEYLQHSQVQPPAQAMQQSSSGVGSTAPSGQAQSVLAQVQSGLAPSQPVGHASAMMPPAGSANGQLVTGQQGSTISLLQQSCSPPINQSAPIGLQASAPPPSSAQQVGQPLQGGMVQQPGSAPGLVQQVPTAPQKQQLLTQPQSQGVENIIQSVNNQQITGISSTPSTVTANQPNVGSNVSTSIPTAPVSAVPQQTTTQTSAVQNGSQPSIPTNVSLPVVQGGLQKLVPVSAQYPATGQSLSKAVEDSGPPADQSVLNVHQVAIGETVLSAANALVQEIASSANLPASASLLPLKTLPLSMQPVDGEDDSSSGASVVAIDNKIEQAMDLVKSHLMYAVREEVEVLKEQIKELVERNSQLEQENNLLKTLASPEQLAQFQAQLQTTGCSPPVSQSGQTTQPTPPNGGSSA